MTPDRRAAATPRVFLVMLFGIPIVFPTLSIAGQLRSMAVKTASSAKPSRRWVDRIVWSDSSTGAPRIVGRLPG